MNLKVNLVFTTVCLIVTGVFCSWQHKSTVMVTKPPNIVFILTDDQRFDELECTGHPFIKTPNLNELAKNGVLFTNFFATSPGCSPSRACLVTGQWERCNTVGFDGSRALSPKQWSETLPMVLKRGGYFTEMIGKINIHGLRPKDVDYFCGSDLTALGFYPKEFDPGKFLFKGANHDTQVELLGDIAKDFLGTDHHFYEQSDPQLKKYLRRRPTNRPFMLYVALEVPHGTGTRTMEQRPTDDSLYKTVYRHLKSQMPRVPGYIARKDAMTPKLPFSIYKGHLYSQTQKTAYGYVGTPETLREQQVRNCQTISGVDRLVGDIRRQLKEIGEEENTIIIFTSDQGIMYGEWGYGGKMLLYEPSMHFPLIIYDPRQQPLHSNTRRSELVVMPDLAPTIIELCQLTPPKSMQGRSISPILKGKKANWREDFFAECFLSGQDYPYAQGVRGKRWKYIRYWSSDTNPKNYNRALNLGIDQEEPQYEELFDLKYDPTEQFNIANDKKYLPQLNFYRQRCTHLLRQSMGRMPQDSLPSQSIIEWRKSESAFFDLLPK